MKKIQIDQLETDGTLPQGIGAMLAPLFTWQGKAIYPVFGAEGDEGTDDDSDGEPSNDGDGDTGDGDDGKSSDAVSREEFDKLRNQLKAADKNKAAAEKRAKELEDAKKDEYTKATERVAELEKTTAAQAKELADMRLQNAFLTANTGITWHDPADALALAERQGYLAEVVDEDGKVDSAKLVTKLKELAKAKKHLVKTGSDEANSTTTSTTRTTPTGSKVGGKNNGGKDEPDLSRYGRLLNR